MVTWSWQKKDHPDIAEPSPNRAQRRAQLIADRKARRRGQRAYNRSQREQ